MSGVLIVIVGWFLTALTAFVAAGAVATVVLWGSKGACIILMLIAVAVIVKENFFASDEKQAATETLQSLDRFGVRKLLNKAVAKNFETSVTIFRDMIRCFLDDNERGLREVSNRAGEFFDNVSEGRAGTTRWRSVRGLTAITMRSSSTTAATAICAKSAAH